ncbi:hypothetical protein [Pseudoalteromonas galatheae]|uniref:hypothetical protein n=1 Tax=Pseudoalteromonas galatheae TaxID=579562 RepID=UPI0030D13235
MDLNTAVLAALSLVVITQAFRQLLPNCFAYPWQLGLHELVPEKYVQHRWFRDKDSLFFFSKDRVIIHTYPLLSQSNLRNVVLLGGLNLWLFLNLNTHEIKQGFDAIVFLLLMSGFLALSIKVVFEGTRKFNPDYVLFITFNIASYLIALQFVTVNF